jgi:tetratricopeptide (TPR) repeat protein
MHARWLAALLAAGTALAASDFEAAMALVHARKPAEARQALEHIVAAEPDHAEAWHELGLLWAAERGAAAEERATQCLERAATLQPSNAVFLGDFGGTLLEIADRHRSIATAIKGRDAMERAVALKPDYVEARAGLFQYYSEAPFFVGGSASKAAAQLEEIRCLAPDRARVLEAMEKVRAKEYGAAFALCEEVLSKTPEDYLALYQYGRIAAMSGQNLERGLSCLRQVLAMEPPGHTAPQPTQAWYRIGDIQQKLGHKAEAQQAYEQALKLDPGNEGARKALERLQRG